MTEPKQVTPAEVEAALLAALPAFVNAFLAERGFEGVLGQIVPIKTLAAMGVVELHIEPKVLFLRPLPPEPPAPSTKG